MTRETNRNSSFGFLIILLVLLILAGAFVARAQVPTSTSTLNIIEYRLPQLEGNPWSLTAGPDGAIWYTVSCAGTCTPPVYDAIGRITTEGAITEYPLPGPSFGRQPYGITTGPDGALWFTESAASQIGRISTSGEIVEYPLPTPNAWPYSITVGPDGALWFTESDANKIGRITTTGRVTEFPVKGVYSTSDPTEIVAGPDGALWFTNLNARYVGRISIQGNITNYPTPAACSPHGITAGPDKALWFACFAGDMIGRVTTGGIITTFNIPTKDSGPIYITLGSDGAFWFTEQNSRQIGRLTIDGHFTEYPAGGVPPIAITTGPDGDIWLGMLRFIAKVVPPSTTTILVSSLNPSFVGQTVTFKATVSSTAGIPTDGEPVIFKNGSAVLGTAPLKEVEPPHSRLPLCRPASLPSLPTMLATQASGPALRLDCDRWSRALPDS